MTVCVVQRYIYRRTRIHRYSRKWTGQITSWRKKMLTEILRSKLQFNISYGPHSSPVYVDKLNAMQQSQHPTWYAFHHPHTHVSVSAALITSPKKARTRNREPTPIPKARSTRPRRRLGVWLHARALPLPRRPIRARHRDRAHVRARRLVRNEPTRRRSRIRSRFRSDRTHLWRRA